VAFFDLAQLDPRGVGDDDLRRWWVRPTRAEASYGGKVLAPVDWTGEDVLASLEQMAVRFGLNVTWGRLYSPVDLGATAYRPCTDPAG
jgi:hypothetical protein